MLGLCHRTKEEGWKCYDGCRVIIKKAKEGRKGLKNSPFVYLKIHKNISNVPIFEHLTIYNSDEK